MLGTATTAEEAAPRERGVDAVVAQGAEAGGHRGTFLGSFEDGLVPIDELVASFLGVPVVAAGGIDRRRGLAALDLGASGAQLGTAFLFTPDASVRGAPRACGRTRPWSHCVHGAAQHAREPR